jgi:hypothetical protein
MKFILASVGRSCGAGLGDSEFALPGGPNSTAIYDQTMAPRDRADCAPLAN